jgi:hypothetical protein
MAARPQAGLKAASPTAVSMNERAARIKARLVRRGPDEESFDREFWAEMDPAAELELLWDMVLEADVWRGGDGTHPRLRESACRLRHRQRAQAGGDGG